MSTTSMDIPPPRKQRRHRAQTFYPCPPSVSEADQYDYSDDESTDGDGILKTFVSHCTF